LAPDAQTALPQEESIDAPIYRIGRSFCYWFSNFGKSPQYFNFSVVAFAHGRRVAGSDTNYKRLPVLPPGHLTLLVEYGNEEYLGQIQLDDAVFCQDLLNALANCIGDSIRDVANIEIGILFLEKGEC
jgi:hypothetical protein